jgi:hypothetical protein
VGGRFPTPVGHQELENRSGSSYSTQRPRSSSATSTVTSRDQPSAVLKSADDFAKAYQPTWQPATEARGLDEIFSSEGRIRRLIIYLISLEK